MNKAQATKEVERLWEALHDHCKSKIKEIEDLCDKFGIVHYFSGLPPFSDYGNSGHYFPAHEDGTPWVSSEERSEMGYYATEDNTGWISSDQGC